MKKVIRSILAVLAGSIAIGIAALGSDYLRVLFMPSAFTNGSPVSGTWLFFLMLTYNLTFSGLGGYLTARLSPNAPMAHVLALAALEFIGGLASAMQPGGTVPPWFQVLVVMLPFPVILLGGKLHRQAPAAA